MLLPKVKTLPKRGKHKFCIYKKCLWGPTTTKITHGGLWYNFGITTIFIIKFIKDIATKKSRSIKQSWEIFYSIQNKLLKKKQNQSDYLLINSTVF